MTSQEAKKVLAAMGSKVPKEWSMTPQHLRCHGPYISIFAGPTFMVSPSKRIIQSTEILALLGGDDFTADQLEAIAAWMRDPRGVAEAGE